MGITCEDMIDIAIRAGSIVLENGGETYRTEGIVNKIAAALGAKTSSSFVTPTVIQFSYTDDNDHYHSAIRRITKRGVNLDKISLIDELTRRIEKKQKTYEPRVIESLLSRIENSPVYKKPLVLFAAALSSFCFAFMFGGSLAEACAAFMIGFILRLFLLFSQKRLFGSFSSSLLSGAISSVLTEIVFLLGFIPSTEVTLISVLMQVVPGLAIVNAIRDIIEGDLVSGAARLLDAFMVAAGLSVGAVAGLFVFKGSFQEELARELGKSMADAASSAVEPSAQALGAAIVGEKAGFVSLLVASLVAALWGGGASGFSSVYLHSKPLDILLGALCGAVGWFVFTLTGGEGASSYLAGAFTVAVLSELLGALLKTPATVYLLPGLLPLVPGGGMFLTMRSAVNGFMEEAASYAYTTLFAAGSIALGIALASSGRRLLMQFRLFSRAGLSRY
ncbi:MAG: threonine/serine exporter family protein [Treponemataceae bacterium]|nr:threonine/serine exporter family protein [Treponemataceae bacterium]